MHTDGDRGSETGTSEPKKPRRLPSGGRAWIVLVACCVPLVWVGSVVLWESKHPAIKAVRKLQSTDPFQRATAIRELEEFGVHDRTTVLPPLIASLADEDAQVRIASVRALETIFSNSMGSATDRDIVPSALTALTKLLKDPQPAVRMVAVHLLGTIGTTEVFAKPSTGKVATTAATATPSLDPQQVVDALAWHWAIRTPKSA